MLVKLTRYNQNDKQTLGVMQFNKYAWHTLELAWNNNEKEKSCIPAGTYKVYRRFTAKYGFHFILQGVKDRSFILIHSGNRYTHTLGCILVGQKLADIDKDGYTDVIQSKEAMDEMLKVLPESFDLEIIFEPRIELN